jgi:predicted enzyme related to lactoylglutathione lyase
MRIPIILMAVVGVTAVASAVGADRNPAGASGSAQDGRLVPSEQIVFLYYKDLGAVEAFFGTTLGLKKTTDLEWVKIFQTVPGSSIGCVKEGRGSLKTAAAKPVMVSWVVDDVEAWHQRLAAKNVKIIQPVHESKEPPMKSFLFQDPTGYTFELMQWMNPPAR